MKDDPEIKAALEYIFSDKKKGDEIMNKALKNVNSKIKKSELQLIEEVKILKLKGNNGIYKADSRNGVVLNKEGATISFQNEEQLDEWIQEFKAVFGMIK